MTEIIHRPALLLTRSGVSADCDDKAILIASWAQKRGIPWRFKAVGYGPAGFSHVYNELMMDGQWVPVDATYERNTLFAETPYRRAING
jgi:transglutaminase-like putative cysteine protease